MHKEIQQLCIKFISCTVSSTFTGAVINVLELLMVSMTAP